jgi:CRISPR/Cas system-associated exonuclease Cas4 (RecB family)
MIRDKIEAFLNAEDCRAHESIAEILSFTKESLAHSFRRQFIDKAENRPTLRLSSIGHCPRKQAYQMHGEKPNGKKIDARAKMVFFQGDQIEAVIVALAQLAGVDITSCGQDQMEVEFEGVNGHPDGIVTHEGKKYLFECKSMSMYGFKDFKAGKIDKAHLFQMNCYMQALSLDKAIYLAFDKNSGHFEERIVDKSETLIAEAKEIIGNLRKTTKEKLPSRPYQKNAKGAYDWHCDYCAYSMTCWPNTEYKFNGKRNVLTDRG